MRLLILLCGLLLLVACGGDDKSATSAPSATDTPDQVAVKFFEAMLVDNDIRSARGYTTASLARVLESFTSGKTAGRTLLNMRYDQVDITVEDTDKSVREFYKDKAEIMLIFTGTYDGGKKVDMRMVKMVQLKGRWLVAEIKTDPFARAGV